MKQLLFFFAAAFFVFTSYAQNTLEVLDTGNITREKWRDSLLRMDLNQVPTGFLLEYSLFGFDSGKFDGVGNDDDTIKNDGTIFELHNILWYSKVNNNAIIDQTDSLYNEALLENKNNHTIPLTFIYQKYNRIRETALSEGLLKIASDSVGILDVPGRQTSPYDSLEIFAFAPFKTKIDQFNSISFTLPDDLFYMKNITSVDIDFDDGAGFRTLTKGSSVNIYYTDTGRKYLTAKIIDNGVTRLAKSMIDYERPETYINPDYSLSFSVAPVYLDDSDYLSTGAQLRLNNKRIQNSSVVFRNENELEFNNPGADIEVVNGCDHVFDKPIIIVEGFDPDGSQTIEEMQDRFSQNNFMATMEGYGYDFVFVHFTDNTTFIENNAKALEAVIDWVNETKTGTNKSTVIGFSMGGLVARWCLKDMEDRGLTHNVENYFSYDAPQQGANVPLGMQYIFKEIAHDLPYLKWFNAGGFRDLYYGFNSPAARQMLVTYADYSNGPFDWTPNLNTLNPLRDAFAQRLINKGYPQQTNNFGIALGRGNNLINTKNAGDGNQFTPNNPFNPQDEIFEGSMGFILVNALAEGYAVPENNVKATIAYYSFSGLTFRKIFGIPFIPTVTLRVRRFKYTGQYPYDDGQGSFEQTQTDFVNNWVSGLGEVDMPPTTLGHDGHNFIATVSALDLQNQTYNSSNDWQSTDIFYNVDNQIQNSGQVNGNTLLTPSLSPFHAVMTSTSDCPSINCNAEPYYDMNGNLVNPPNPSAWNNYHNTDINIQTARFIERNILDVQPVDCAGGNGLCNGNPTISGPDVICTNGQYQLSNPPNGVTINWEMQNGKLKIDNGQGTPIIDVSKVNSGSEIVKATLTNACGAQVILTKQITVGPPTALGINVSGGGFSNMEDCGDATDFKVLYNSANLNYSGSLYVTASNATSLSWTEVSNSTTPYWAWSTTNNGYTLNVSQKFSNKYLSLKVTATNACGSINNTYTFGSNVCPIISQSIIAGDDYLLAPNPAGDNVTVSVNSGSKNSEAVSFAQIRIYDVPGNLKKQLKYSSGTRQAQINISDLLPGYYYVEISNGKTAERKPLVVQR